MNHKPNLLVVGDYNRRNFVDFFKGCKEDFNFLFIEYASPKEVTNEYYRQYGKALFWKDFADAFDLLKTTRPVKVVFFFIESYNHVALNVACKELGIPTYHLEHGVRNYERSVSIDQLSAGQKKSRLKRYLKAMPEARIKMKNRLFFSRTVKKASAEASIFLQHYYTIRSKNSIVKTFQAVKSPYRIADVYISFSPCIYKAHQMADHLPETQMVHFIGLPDFDDWADFQPAAHLQNGVLFIDQAFVRQELLGWTKAYKDRFVNDLVSVCHANGYKLYVKIHPLEDAGSWRKAEADGKAKIIENAELHQLAKEVKLVMGFYSTLLMPLAAMPQTTLLTLENHPAQGVFPSKFLVESGVANAFYSVAELSEAWNEISGFHVAQQQQKEEFVKNWLYRLDGKAGERLRAILTP